MVRELLNTVPTAQLGPFISAAQNKRKTRSLLYKKVAGKQAVGERETQNNETRSMLCRGGGNKDQVKVTRGYSALLLHPGTTVWRGEQGRKRKPTRKLKSSRGAYPASEYYDPFSGHREITVGSQPRSPLISIRPCARPVVYI